MIDLLHHESITDLCYKKFKYSVFIYDEVCVFVHARTPATNGMLGSVRYFPSVRCIHLVIPFLLSTLIAKFLFIVYIDCKVPY